MTRSRLVALWLLSLVLVVPLAIWLAPEPAPLYREVQVPVEVIKLVERVDTVVTWKERIVYRTPKATQVAVAVGGGQQDVERFCPPPAVAADSTVIASDNPGITKPVLLLRSVRHQDAWFFGKDKLYLTGPLSNGDLKQLTYEVRPGYQTIVHGDSVIMQYPRAALMKQIGEAAVWAAAGAVIAKVIW